MQKRHNYYDLTVQERLVMNWFTCLYVAITGILITCAIYHNFQTNIINPKLKALEILIIGILLAGAFYFGGWLVLFLISRFYYLISWPMRIIASLFKGQAIAPLFPVKYQVGRYSLSAEEITSVYVSYLDSPAEVWEDFLTTKFSINTLVIARTTTYSRESGAFFDINAGLLREHRQLVRDKIIRRSDYDRQRAIVPGWRTIKNNDYSYHRTHLIPFRYVLSEGYDIPGLLFTGTAQLNSGNRPKNNYVVGNTGFLSHKKRQKLLLRYFNHHQGRPLETSSIKEIAPISGIFTDNDFIFSLDDFERLSDYYIQHAPTHNFRYGAFTDPSFDTMEIVPESLSVYLYDMSTKQFCFQATIPNVH